MPAAGAVGRGEMEDMLGRLRLDPGSWTLGQLLQERQWAAQEITRLRAEVAQLRSRARETAWPAE